MSRTIEMGNDEFILYIRKTYPECKGTNEVLGRKIWEWIRDTDPNATQTKEDAPCLWRHTGAFIAEDKLPKTATQFSFRIDILPALFGYLDELGKE
jgi:hypothetical protein